MLTTVTDQIVSDAVRALINRKAMFSVYDVTKAARQQTPNRIDHTDVQIHVHDAFANGDFPQNYTRTLHTFRTSTGQRVQAYVFHPVTEDVNDYDPDSVLQPHVAAMAALGGGIIGNVQQTGTTATFNVGPAQQQPAPKQASSNNWGGVNMGKSPTTQVVQPHVNVTADTRGRVCLPNALVKAAGFKAGDTAYLHQSSQQGLLVVAPQQWNHPLLATLVVDKDSNIRITPSVLRRNGYNGSTFKVRGDNTHIVVEQ